MRNKVQLAVSVIVLCLVGCATTSLKKTWKSPAYQAGPVQKVAIVGVEDRGVVRVGFENRFVRDFRAQGQESLPTHEMLTLAEIKADKQAASRRLREAGVDAVLIVRLVDQVTYDNEVRATPALFVGNVSGIENYGWYDYYSVAFTDMGTVWGNTKQKTYIDASLFELKTNQRIWSGLTLTTLKEESDRLEAVDEMVAKVVAAMRKDSMVR